MTKLKAIRELIKYDHCFLPTTKVRELTKPFGFEGSVYLAHDTRNEIKGLTLPEGKDMEGQDADIIACEIAEHLKIDYLQMFGRGSQLRSACEAVEKHLLKKP